MSWKCYHECPADIVPARPRSKVTTTFPAVFMIAESSSFSPAANIISFWTNWGGPDWTGPVVSSELSKDDPSVSLSSSDSVSEVSPSWQARRTTGSIRLPILTVMWSSNGASLYLSLNRQDSVFVQVDLGRRTHELVAQPQNKEGREKDAKIWGQETHNVPRVHQTESVNTYRRFDFWASPIKKKILNCDFFFFF